MGRDEEATAELIIDVQERIVAPGVGGGFAATAEIQNETDKVISICNHPAFFTRLVTTANGSAVWKTSTFLGRSPDMPSKEDTFSIAPGKSLTVSLGTMDRAIAGGSPLTSWRIAQNPQKPGIYLICAPPPNQPAEFLSGNLYNAMYAGRATISLQRRFEDHCRRPDKNIQSVKQTCGAKLDFWFSIVPAEKIIELEAVLIDCLGPSGNRQRGEIAAIILAPVPA